MQCTILHSHNVLCVSSCIFHQLFVNFLVCFVCFCVSFFVCYSKTIYGCIKLPNVNNVDPFFNKFQFKSTNAHGHVQLNFSSVMLILKCDFTLWLFLSFRLERTSMTQLCLKRRAQVFQDIQLICPVCDIL